MTNALSFTEMFNIFFITDINIISIKSRLQQLPDTKKYSTGCFRDILIPLIDKTNAYLIESYVLVRFF